MIGGEGGGGVATNITNITIIRFWFKTVDFDDNNTTIISTNMVLVILNNNINRQIQGGTNMGRMKEIYIMHEEGYSIEYIAWQMKTNTVTIKKIIYGDANVD